VWKQKGEGKMKTTKVQLVDELARLRQRVSELEASETECKQAEEVLRELEERYRLLFEQAADSIIVVDVDSGELVDFNERAHMNLGYSREEFQRLRIADFEVIESEEEVAKRTRRISREGAALFETKHRTKSGDIRDVEVMARALSAGGRNMVQSILRDITERKRVEEALKSGRDKLQALMDGLARTEIGIDIIGLDCKVISQNQTLQERFGDLTGKLCYENYMGLEKPCDFCPMTKAVKGNKVESVELTAADGRDYRLLSAPLPNPDGTVDKAIEVVMDITERKQVEEALRQSEERYRTVLDEMEDSYFEVDLSGHITFANESTCRNLRLSREELMGASYKTFSAENSIEDVYKAFNKSYRTGKPVKSFSWEIVRGDGSTGFAETTVLPLHNQDGQIIGFRGIGRDITERKQMEEALRESEERYRLLAENAKDAIWTVDMNMRPTFMSPSITSLLGYSVEEAMVKSMEEVYTPASLEIAMKLFAEEVAIENMEHKDLSRSRVLELELIHKDGSIVPIEGKFSFIRGPDAQPVEILSIVRDITERKQMEEERKQLEQKAHLESRLASLGLLASGVGHEINNPLTGVIGYAQLLLEKDIPEDVRKDVESINKEAQRVANIVKRLVAFARYQKPQRTYAGIGDIVAATVDLLAHQLETSNIQTNLHLDPNLPWTIADIGQLQQVFLNLIINAETEMRLAHGKGKLSIKTEKADNTIRICFQDDGPGIAKDNLEKIFDPFFTTREVGEGTGLGLSICHEIMAEHNGSIYAESKPGKGATFIVELPIVAEEKHPQAAEPVAEEAVSVAGARILVVDDEQVILDFVSRVLTDEGHEVETVDNAQDALRKIKSERYGLILLDIKLPGMSGIELYNHIEKTAQSLARRVVFITGDVMGAETTAFLSRIKAPRIDKPFDAEQLKSEINRMLAQGRS